MKIRSIDILGVKHKIKYIKCPDNIGGFYCPDNLIEISKDSSGEDHLKDLLHECLHGVLFHSGVHQDISIPQEHCIIDSSISFLLKNFDIKLKKKR